jgi:feruloyl esterase
MKTRRTFWLARVIGAVSATAMVWQLGAPPADAQSPAGSTRRPLGPDVAITASDCTPATAGTSIPPSAIGEPVRSVTLSPPMWIEAANSVPAHCRVNGTMAPVDTASTAKPINFSVVLPASWGHRAAQFGGGGINGVVPNLTSAGPAGPSLVSRGFATYGSDSGHQMSFGPGRGGPPPAGAVPQAAGRGAAGAGRGDAGRGGSPFGPNPATDDWALNEEAIANLGYAQMKKTRDAAMVVIERVYDARPRFNYYVGNSQGGREGLTVAQRYPADYDGVAANVPIVGFSSLMLAPEVIRIHEKPLANWVTPAKVNAIRGEFMRQCDSLDGLADGIINNYMACRAIFDVTQGAANRRPWAARRCPDNVDPSPGDESANACLTDGQISTLELTYSRYPFATPLAHGARSFGMWVPNTDPSGSGLILNARFKGQEGAADSAPMHSHLGVLGVVGFLMKNLSANPLDYVEGGPLNRRREELSAVLDSTNPDLSAFQKRGGKMVVAIGTNDTLASPGAQLDYYQAVLDRMGRAEVDRFARLFVMPQTGHGLSGNNYGVDGEGRTIPSQPIPNRYDQLGLLFDWVENGVAPGMSVTVTAGERSLPLCSYPAYPRYRGGDAASAASYECATTQAR